MCCCTMPIMCCAPQQVCCSEYVGVAADNNALCSACLTGTCQCVPVCTPTPGTGTDICSPTSTSCVPVDISACLPYAGMDINGNEIYQNPDGSLTYSDGSPATRADIAYNCGACPCTPCSPATSGNSEPALTGGGGSVGGGPQGGGSGSGSAKPGGSTGNSGSLLSKLSQAMNRFGGTMASLFTGGRRVPTGKVLPGQAVNASVTGVSSNAFFLVILIVGGLLLLMAFGHKPEGD